MSSKDDAIIAAAAAEAARKRRHFASPKKMTAAEILSMPHPGKDQDYCAVCQYPKDPTAPGGCRYCYEQKLNDQAKLSGWVEAMGGQRAWQDYTLAHYQVTPFNAPALRAAQAFDPRKHNLFLHGPRGTGKSHTAAIAKRPMVTQGYRVKTVSMPSVMDEILAGIKGGQYAGLTKDWLRVMTTTPILSIEDLGVEKPTDHVLGFYYKFINGRYEAKRAGMIITCNYSLDELENRWAAGDAHGRVVSRLKEMCRGNIHSFSGLPDFREGEGR